MSSLSYYKDPGLDDAKSLEGSVFDTGSDWLKRVLAAPERYPSSILDMVPGNISAKITNPTHPMAQFMQRSWPKVYNALDKRPQLIKFGESPIQAPESGAVKFPPNALKGKYLDEVDLSKLQTVDNPTGNQQPIKLNTKPYIQRMADTNDEKHVTALHEALHVLYGTKPGYAEALLPEEHALNITLGNNRPPGRAPAGTSFPAGRTSRGAVARSGLGTRKADELLSTYEPAGDMQHSGLEFTAQAMRNKQRTAIDAATPSLEKRFRNWLDSVVGLNRSGRPGEPAPSLREFGASPAAHKELNDYARFVMGKTSAVTKDVDPNILRQLEGAGQRSRTAPYLSTAHLAEGPGVDDVVNTLLNARYWAGEQVSRDIPRMNTATHNPIMSVKTDNWYTY